MGVAERDDSMASALTTADTVHIELDDSWRNDASDIKQDIKKGPSSCCGGDPCCVLCFKTRFQCMIFCVLPCLLILAPLVFVLWPRCIKAGVDNSSVKITSMAYVQVPPRVNFGVDMDVVVKNDNYWGVDIDHLKVTGKYRGAVLGISDLRDGLSVSARGPSRFNIQVKQEATVEAATAAAVAAPYYLQDCGVVPDPSRTWPLTLHNEVEVMGYSVTFDVSFNVPCVTVNAGSPGMSPFGGTDSGDHGKCLIPGTS